ncbi:hypothetical protein [Hyphococcus sp.]|uniref:hypothetical protein n=1 Tax=Hyphococcus sp. TaxID=2038636 RepID=UPI0035C6CF52
MDAPKGRLEMLAPLETENGPLEGLRLRGIAVAARREANVLFQLEYDGPGRKCEPLSRIEWRPPGLHINRDCGPWDWVNIPQIGSHHHAFEINYLDGKDTMKRNARQSAPIVPDLPDYDDLRKFVMKDFKINGPGDTIPYPPWSEGLF